MEWVAEGGIIRAELAFYSVKYGNGYIHFSKEEYSQYTSDMSVDLSTKEMDEQLFLIFKNQQPTLDYGIMKHTKDNARRVLEEADPDLRKWVKDNNINQTTLDPKSGHYDAGGIETIEILKAKLTKEQYEGYLLGNIIKYSTRANFKDQFNRDIEKINVYSNLLKQLNEDK